MMIAPMLAMLIELSEQSSCTLYKNAEGFGLDDVVGAPPVHMFAGIFGTLVVPFGNSDTSFGTQFIGVISVCAFSFVLSFGVFKILKETIGLRISKAKLKD